MIIEEQSLDIDLDPLLYFDELANICGRNKIPIRFAIVSQTGETFHCELSSLSITKDEESIYGTPSDIFEFNQRMTESQDKFTVVAVVPTGIGASVGGHSGDAQSAMRLLSFCCDTLITHPNTMNGADINELMPNMLYVEGSTLARLLMGAIGLKRRRANRILLVVEKKNRTVMDLSINSASAARMSLGADIDVIEMDCGYSKILMSESGRAIGSVQGIEKLLDLGNMGYDAIALSTFVDYEDEMLLDYFKDKTHVNPWGGIEAIVTHCMSLYLNKPVAHSPMNKDAGLGEIDLGIVNPCKASEVVSTTYLHCILKGLHKSPAIVNPNEGLNASDVNVMVIPDRCIGLPVLAALKQGIKVIFVDDSENIMRNNVDSLPWAKGQIYHASNYLEAAGILNSIRIGMSPDILKRPVQKTTVIGDGTYA